VGILPGELLPAALAANWPPLYQRALSEGAFRVEYSFVNGRTLELSLNPIVTDGKTTGISVFGKDISERKQAELRLRESEFSLRQAETLGTLGRYLLDVSTQSWTSSEVMDEIFGIGKHYDRSIAGWTTLVHPDDRTSLEAYFFEEVIGQKKDFNRQYRIVRHKDRAERWVHGIGRLLFDEQRNPLKMHGIIRDITESKLAEMHLRDSEERYRATFAQAAVGIVHTSFDGAILRCNARFAEIVGYPHDEVPGLLVQQITAPEDCAETKAVLESVSKDKGFTGTIEKRYVHKDGTRTWAKLTVSMQRDGEGRALHFMAFAEDINARKVAEEELARAQEAMRNSEVRYRTVFQMSPDFVTISRLSDGAYVDANKTFFDVMGFEREEVIGRTSLELNIWADARDRQNFVEVIRQNSNCRNLEAKFRKKNGEILSSLVSSSAIEADGVPCLVSITRDISDAKEAAERIRDLAFYDPLTHLPNRRLLLDRLSQTPAVRFRRRKRALLFVDLDDFKTLNDIFGHQTGDLLLQEVARRLVACTREADTISRLGGDEFVVLLEYLSDVSEEAAAQAEVVGDKVLAAIGHPFVLAEREFHKTSSIGIAVFEAVPEDPNEVLEQAEIAMHQAKVAGSNTTRFFSPTLQAAAHSRAALEAELRQAIKMRQFELYYQPQVEHGRLIGVEALLRWNHPKRGVLGPAEFICVAEETGLIHPLGGWAFESACTQIAAWAHDQEMAHISVAVNISARQFRQPDFVAHVLTVLERTGADPRNLKLELTESMLVDDLEDVIAKMTALRSRGLSFSMDDFGTGYSSLAYLKRLPLEQLKIDRGFTRDVLVDVVSGAIAQTVISLGKAMGLSVIAEGVETEGQLEFLTGLGCFSFQGYLFSRPLPLEEFHNWLRAFIAKQVVWVRG
jgi:diguanylate cyclase (GGDEF)-like protein/PAS domain S-box-containing protein